MIAEDGGWFGLDDLFWLTVLVIFLATIIGALVRRLRKDKCVKLLDDHHVTYLAADGSALWGDLSVSSQGLELRYDAPFTTSRGLLKSGYLVYPDEWGSCVALCRSIHGLTEAEREERLRQVRRTFHPGPVRRLLRAFRNLVNTIRDAITKTLGLFVGAMAARGGMGQAMGSRRGEVDELGQTLVGVVANAYEPLLERHIGRPVVLSVQGPPGVPEKVSEFPGFLVDYTERFVALFNVEHESLERIELEVVESVRRDGFEVALEGGRLEVLCTGPEALVVHGVRSGENSHDLGVTLLPGCRLGLPRVAGQAVSIVAERTRTLDVVCPRARARVRFASDRQESRRGEWKGLAPEPSGADTDHA